MVIKHSRNSWINPSVPVFVSIKIVTMAVHDKFAVVHDIGVEKRKIEKYYIISCTNKINEEVFYNENKKQKTVKTVIVFIAMFIIVGMYIVPVTSNAGQIAKGWGISFDYDGQDKYTDSESKNTTSSVRMYCEYSDCYNSYYYAKVFSERNGSRRDASHGIEYSFSEGETKDMLNWVVENGYDEACVKLTGENIDTEYGTCFNGYWWPDVLD